MKSKLIIVALGLGAASLAMAQNQTSDANATAPTQDQTAAASQDQATGASALDTDNTIRSLNQASFDNRKQALDDIDSRIGKAHRSMLKAEVKGVFHKESSEAKSDYKTAREEEKSARSEVKSRLKDAQNSTADNWETNRSALAQAFQRYSEAVGKVDACAMRQNQDESQAASSATDQNAPQSQNATPNQNTSSGDRTTQQ